VTPEEALANALEQMPEELDEHQRLVQTQLALICRQLGPLRTLAGHLIKEGEPAAGCLYGLIAGAARHTPRMRAAAAQGSDQKPCWRNNRA
jgi:hypothetical protein